MNYLKPHAYLCKNGESPLHQLLVMVPMNRKKLADLSYVVSPPLGEAPTSATREVEIRLNVGEEIVAPYMEYLYLEINPLDSESYLHIMTFVQSQPQDVEGDVTLYYSDADHPASILFQADQTPPIDDSVPCIHLGNPNETDNYWVSVLIPKTGRVLAPEQPATGEPTDEVYYFFPVLEAGTGPFPISKAYGPIVDMQPQETAEVEVQDGPKKRRKRTHQSYSDPKDLPFISL